MISTLRHIVSLAKIPVAMLVLSAFLLGQFVEVWHYHSPTEMQSDSLSVGGFTKTESGAGHSHESCPICSSSQCFKDLIIKPVTTVFTSLVKSTLAFLKHTLYSFLSSVLKPGRAPPAF
ncbi:MAG: hypothetical protein IPM69_16205 [Ignavibacteria bacterium]|nr:hypothetical protein [Ignavibacteria bacterium]